MALVARRENGPRGVANLACQLGSPDVVIIQGDVSTAEDCERFVNQTMDRCLDHVVTNAGIAPTYMLEDCPDITKLAPAMVQVTAMPIRSVEGAAEEIVKGGMPRRHLLDGTSVGEVDRLREGVLPRGTPMAQQVAVVGWDQDLIEECA
ncbi:hypothetical protein NL676_003429 [Syzygium grande]|nr:hypothetical protein NL676_003429 [Syzygium grande]